jgi:hypothetical protein
MAQRLADEYRYDLAEPLTSVEAEEGLAASTVTELNLRAEHERPNSGSTLLDALVAESPSPEVPAVDAHVARESVVPSRAMGRAQESFVGECLDTRHPTLAGRVLIRWADARGAVRERWLPTLHGLAIQQTDRVLAQQPSNWSEPIVTGVIDGYAQRPDVPRASVATIALKSDEAILVTTTEGAPLLELRGTDQGPVARLLTMDADIEAPGQLRLSAKGIELNATEGSVTINASDDVTVKGESIRLN